MSSSGIVRAFVISPLPTHATHCTMTGISCDCRERGNRPLVGTSAWLCGVPLQASPSASMRARRALNSNNFSAASHANG